MMTCREVTDFLDDYLDGTLASDVAARFDEHLRLCPPCVRYLESYKLTIKACRDSCADDACCDVPESLVQAILAARLRS